MNETALRQVKIDKEEEENMSQGNRISRRSFIRNASLATAAFSIKATTKSTGAEPAGEQERPINLGIVGTGNRGRTILRNIVRMKNINVLGVADIFPANLRMGKRMAGRNAQDVEDYRKLLDMKEIEAVLVVTPQHTHSEISIAALDAGKHVFCEKCMAFTIEQAREIVEAVRRTRKFFQVGHQRRYNPLYLKALQHVQQGVLGPKENPITHIRCQWNSNSDWRAFVPEPKWEKVLNWRLYKEISGGLMAEFGAHQVDVADWFLDATPIAVSGVGNLSFYKDDRDIYDHINVLIEYPKGVTMNYTSMLTNGYDGVGEQFMGPNGTITLSLGYPLGTGQLTFEPGKKQPIWVKLAHTEEVEGRTVVTLIAGKKYVAGTEEDAQEQIGAEGEKNDIVCEFEEFFKTLREGSPPVADVMVGYRDVVTVVKANEAMEKQTRLEIDPELFEV
jgi:predicted dehydrogenase